MSVWRAARTTQEVQTLSVLLVSHTNYTPIIIHHALVPVLPVTFEMGCRWAAETKNILKNMAEDSGKSKQELFLFKDDLWVRISYEKSVDEGHWCGGGDHGAPAGQTEAPEDRIKRLWGSLNRRVPDNQRMWWRSGHRILPKHRPE